MSISQTLAKAQHSMVVGRIDEALKLYRGLLRVMPKHPLVNGLLGEALARSGSPHAAVAPLRLAHEGDPRNVQYWLKLIAVHHMLMTSSRRGSYSQKLVIWALSQSD